MEAPPLSVVMPVHNALPYLGESIRSIVGQSFADFELVVLDDGSTDGSTEVLREWARRDARIRLVEGGERLGPAASSARVVSLSTAPLVARMDADDVSHPDRLRRQVEVLRDDPAVGMVGTLWEGIDAAGRVVRPRDLWRAARRSAFAPFPHGSIMYRRALFERAGGYRQACVFWEDVDLFVRMAAAARVVVIPEALYLSRFAETSTRLTSDRRHVEEAINLMLRCVARFRETGEYESLLAGRPAAEKISPDVYVSLGSSPLWAGRSPRALGPLWRSGGLAWNASSARVLLWAAWAGASPRTLRLLLRSLVRMRNLAAARRIGGAATVEWRPS